MFSLAGRKALVTGASGAIGKGIAEALASQGAQVALSGTRVDALGALAASLAGSVVAPGDLATAEGAEGVFAATEAALGQVDILVNNAGLTRDGLIARMSDEDWRTVIDTNLGGAFATCRAAARGMMKRRSGSIINLTSVVGLHGNPGQTNYAASKAGLIGLTKALARELATRGVRVNAIAPGYIETALTGVLPEAVREAILGNTPLGRLGTPEDVAGAVRFLCSDEASFITGEVLLVDGGLGM